MSALMPAFIFFVVVGFVCAHMCDFIELKPTELSHLKIRFLKVYQSPTSLA